MSIYLQPSVLARTTTTSYLTIFILAQAFVDVRVRVINIFFPHALFDLLTSEFPVSKKYSRHRHYQSVRNNFNNPVRGKRILNRLFGMELILSTDHKKKVLAL